MVLGSNQTGQGWNTKHQLFAKLPLHNNESKVIEFYFVLTLILSHHFLLWLNIGVRWSRAFSRNKIAKVLDLDFFSKLPADLA